MMPKQQDVLKQRLETERDRLISELEQLNPAGHGNLGYSTHMADDASAAFDQARDLALRSNLERMLAQVKGALERFADGTYGVCESCGQAIDPARLKALPHAACCLDCQRRLEH
jgi:RNA polymerase-binding protein DksA